MTNPDSSHLATPGCGCDRCRAVFDEWGEQAMGFQRWLGQAPEHMLNMIGLTRQSPNPAQSESSQ